MKAIATFDTLGLPKTGQLLFAEADHELFNQRVDKLKRYVKAIAPQAILHTIGPRLQWVAPNPSKYEQDRAREILIVILEDDSSYEKPVASQLEKKLAETLDEFVRTLIAQGYDQAAIPTLFANAAYLCVEEMKGKEPKYHGRLP